LPPRPTDASPRVEPAQRLREAERPAPTRYTVERGDTLCSIARDYYGDAGQWVRIRDANAGIDPDRLKVGQVLVLPPKSEAASGVPAQATTPGAGRATYVVERGDTLISIARQVFGDGSRWREIYELNRDKLPDPNRLLPGTELRMPPMPSRSSATTRP
jgi:nucleoid-associated protein YgaU